MNTKSIIGVILIVVGLLGFVFGGIPYSDDETVVDIGEFEIEAEQERTFPIAPVAAGLSFVGGIFLVAAGRKD